jgi:stage V sporulation protein G
MPRRAPLRYKMDENGEMRSTFNGKFPEEFNERDVLAFAADTDILLTGKVSKETLAAIHAAGYEYQGGAVIPQPGKEKANVTEETRTPTQETAPMKLDVSVRAIQPMGNLLGFASVKFNDCFVVEDFKILQTDKGLYVGMPSKPDKTSRTGYRDTAKPITGDFRKQLQGAVLEAYSAEIGRLRAVAAAQERPSIKDQLEAGAKEAAKERAARPPKEKPAKGAER